MNFNKKAVTEITSFVLITLLVVIAASSAYLYSLDQIDDALIVNDRENMIKYIKKINYKITQIQNFNGETTNLNVAFNKGEFGFLGNTIFYESEVKSSISGSNCFDNICYSSPNGFEKIFFNLSNSYYFDQNFTISPGSYNLVFSNNKNESKIKIKFN